MLRVVNRLFDGGLPTLNAARRATRPRTAASFYDQVLDTDAILVLSSPTFDFASPFVPTNVSYVGPILDDPSWAEPWQQPWPETNRDPLVLVGFSSTFQDQAPLLQRVVDALSVDARASRRHDRADARPRRAAVDRQRRRGPLRTARGDPARTPRLTVTHCGHGTVMKSLAAGVPMVCIPMGRDQNDNAARIVHHGAGLRLPTQGIDDTHHPSRRNDPRSTALPRQRAAATGRRDRRRVLRVHRCRRADRGAHPTPQPSNTPTLQHSGELHEMSQPPNPNNTNAPSACGGVKPETVR